MKIDAISAPVDVQAPRTKTLVREMLLVFTAAYVIRFVWVMTAPSNLLADFLDYDRLGWELASRGGYNGSLGAPTAFRPPGLPFLLAAIYSVAGHELLAVRVVNAVMGALTCVLVHRICVKLGLRAAALPAALALAFYPNAVYYAHLIATEVPFTLLLVCLFLGYLHLRDLPAEELGGPRVHGVVALLGAALGMAILLRPVLIPIAALVALTQARHLLGSIRSIRLLAVGAATCGVLVGSWVCRNYLVLGEPVLATIGGIDFYIGNNPAADGGYAAPAALHAHGLTDRDFNHVGWQLGFDHIAHHPWSLATGAVRKTLRLFALEQEGFFFTFHTMQTFLSGVHSLSLVRANPSLAPLLLLPLAASAFVMATGLCGLKRAHGMPGRGPVLLLLGSFVAVHAVFFGDPRFHYPLIPFLVISSVHAIGRRRSTGWRALLELLSRNASWGDRALSTATVLLVCYWLYDAGGRFVAWGLGAPGAGH
ncbi:MAG: glycosyltransferase family 39 protein [Polyangiaceae bacterium]|nr:glycosyltransferase family 39 protein [Polyangiaceae bacterium]